MTALILATGPVQEGNEQGELQRDLARVLGEALGQPVVIVAEKNYTNLLSAVTERRVDLAWLPPALYVRAMRSVPHGLRAERYSGGLYQAAIFVRSNSRITSIEHLRDRRVAWVDQQSCAGYLFPRAALRHAGIDPDDCFASELFAQNHARVVQLVEDGTVDAGATYVQLADAADPSKGIHIAGWTAFVDAHAMRAIVVSSSIPADVLGIGARVPEEAVPDLIRAITNFHSKPRATRLMRAMFGCDRFVAASAKDYAPVRQAMVADGLVSGG